MRVFQIINEQVLIINGDEQYSDSSKNYVIDSGNELPGDFIIYDDVQKKPTIGRDKFVDYPVPALDAIIDNIDAIIEAKNKRLYQPPSLDQLKMKALDYQYQLYVAKKEAMVYVDDMGFRTDDAGQRDWQIALTLLNYTGKFKVYDKDGNAELREVTEAQMMKAGNAARAQQLAAYEDFVAIREKIKDCTTEDELSAYLPTETA